MNYIEEIKEYGKKLPEDRQQDLVSIIKVCSKLYNLSPKWFYTALHHKPIETWEKHGFGLFRNKGFQTEISRKMEQPKEDMENIDTLENLFSDYKEEEEPAEEAVEPVTHIAEKAVEEVPQKTPEELTYDAFGIVPTKEVEKPKESNIGKPAYYMNPGKAESIPYSYDDICNWYKRCSCYESNVPVMRYMLQNEKLPYEVKACFETALREKNFY